VFVVYGIIALLVLGFLVAFVYVKKPKYGLALGTIVFFLVVGASVLYLSEDKRVQKSEQKIAANELRLDNVVMVPAYGNNYKINAQLSNLSTRYQVTSVLLRLDLKDCGTGQCIDEASSEKRVKVWLKPGNKKNFETYIKFEQLARERSKQEWQLNIVSSLAK